MRFKGYELVEDNNFSPVYHDDSSGFTKELCASRESLEELICKPFNRLNSLVNMIGDDMYEHFGFVAEALIEHEMRRLKKACQLLTEQVGDICFDTPQRDIYGYDGTPFRAWIKKPDEENEEEEATS